MPVLDPFKSNSRAADGNKVLFGDGGGEPTWCGNISGSVSSVSWRTDLSIFSLPPSSSDSLTAGRTLKSSGFNLSASNQLLDHARACAILHIMHLNKNRYHTCSKQVRYINCHRKFPPTPDFLINWICKSIPEIQLHPFATRHVSSFAKVVEVLDVLEAFEANIVSCQQPGSTEIKSNMGPWYLNINLLHRKDQTHGTRLASSMLPLKWFIWHRLKHTNL